MEFIISHFLLKHHLDSSPDLEKLFNALEEALQQGSSCLDLHHYAEKNQLSAGELVALTAILHVDAKGSAVSSPGFETTTPLILTEGNLLYFQRYFFYETSIANKLKLVALTNTSIQENSSSTLLDKLFLETNLAAGEIDLQKQAALTSLRKNLLILSGGPGTGKTTTVVKILSLLRESDYFLHPDEVLLIAPTGKAANRLSQSLQSGKSSIVQKNPELDELAHSLPSEASTIHRALGLGGTLKGAKFHQSNPLPQRLFVIDEASMIDLSLMHQLLLAIPNEAKVIILGDENQLSSIQVGTIMADLIQISKQPSNPLVDCHVHLTKTFRNGGAIKEACDALAIGKISQAIAQLQLESEDSNLRLEPLPSDLTKALTSLVHKHWLPILTNTTLSDSEKLTALETFKILCPTRNGTYGLYNVNSTIETILQKAGVKTDHQYYTGKSVMVTRNNHE
ncbi:AAA family ATPase, partial [Akkermansiaceae bacterium]|nr:AAA family ATPase [Akkermansiaceae bacterium]